MTEVHHLSTADLNSALLALVVVVGAALLGGGVMRVLRQPPVVGEILAGILLGPSLLGALAPEVSAALFPSSVVPLLELVAHLGLVLFMLLVGLEVDTKGLSGRKGLLTSVSAGALVLPLLLGAGAGLLLVQRGTSQGPDAAFVVFLATALTVTAFPVLARILRDRGLAGTTLGSLALGVAAVTDVVAWTLVALAVSLADPGGDPWVMLGGGLALAAFLLLGVRPVLARLDERGVLARMDPKVLLVTAVLGALAAAWVTSSTGLHDVFGPFLLGLALPRSIGVRELLEGRLEHVSTGFLLPAFFVVAGMGVDLPSLLDSGLVLFLALTALAVAGKVAGAYLGARVAALDPRSSLTLGVLLSTRGLTELVVLSIGREAGLLSTELYTALVAMALLTTVATGPLLALLERRGERSTAKVHPMTPAGPEPARARSSSSASPQPDLTSEEI